MKKKFRNYEEILNEDLQDLELAKLYLNEALKDEDPSIFLLALKDICRARQLKVKKIAEASNISRENLYRILSKKGNPKFNNIISLLNSVGYSLSVNINKK